MKRLLADAPIRRIFCNGRKSYDLLCRFIAVDVPARALPSTSPANASYSFDRLRAIWAKALLSPETD